MVFGSLLKNAAEELGPLQEAVKELVTTIDPNYGKTSREFFVGFEGSFGNKHVTPRTLTSRFLGNLVCVEGIVTKCEYLNLDCEFMVMGFFLGSLAKLKVVQSVHYCPATEKFTSRNYTDLTSTDAFPSISVYPTKVFKLEFLGFMINQTQNSKKKYYF